MILAILVSISNVTIGEAAHFFDFKNSKITNLLTNAVKNELTKLIHQLIILLLPRRNQHILCLFSSFFRLFLLSLLFEILNYLKDIILRKEVFAL